MTIPSISGDISSTWPIIITAGEKSKLKIPRGPLREKMRNTRSPMATVGILHRVCTVLINNLLPRKLLKCITLPRGIHIAVAMRQEAADIHSDLPAILITVGSKVNISWNAFTSPSQISDNYLVSSKLL